MRQTPWAHGTRVLANEPSSKAETRMGAQKAIPQNENLISAQFSHFLQIFRPYIPPFFLKLFRLYIPPFSPHISTMHTPIFSKYSDSTYPHFLQRLGQDIDALLLVDKDDGRWHNVPALKQLHEPPPVNIHKYETRIKTVGPGTLRTTRFCGGNNHTLDFPTSSFCITAAKKKITGYDQYTFGLCSNGLD